MKPFIFDFLKHNSFQKLEDEYGVKSRPSSCGTKFSLNYDQLLVKSGDPVSEQCRGMIVRPSSGDFFSNPNWKIEPVGDIEIVAWPMNRFYNHGDSSAHDVDWNDPDLQVYEKLDGTMCILYWDHIKEQWHVATRSVPEADLPITNGGIALENMSFSALFWRALDATLEEELGYRDGSTFWLNVLNKEYTYVFELTTPVNRIVVKYDKFRVTLIAIRHTSSGIEHDIRRAAELCQAPMPKTPKFWGSLNDPEALAEFVNSADPSDLEGAVVLDSSFKRVKVKSKAWVLSSKAKDLVTISRRAAVRAIIDGTIDDVIPIVEKEIAEKLCVMRGGVKKYLDHIDATFRNWKVRAGEDRRAFATLVTSSDEWPTPYFQLFKGEHSHAALWIEDAAARGRLTPSAIDVIIQNIDCT